MVEKIIFLELETSIVNSFILFNEYTTKENIKKMSHTKFREKLLMSLIKDFVLLFENSANCSQMILSNV